MCVCGTLETMTATTTARHNSFRCIKNSPRLIRQYGIIRLSLLDNDDGKWKKTIEIYLSDYWRHVCKLYYLGLILALMGTFLWTFLWNNVPISVVITAPFTGSNEDFRNLDSGFPSAMNMESPLTNFGGCGRSKIGDFQDYVLNYWHISRWNDN